jgi:hypothetical protein
MLRAAARRTPARLGGGVSPLASTSGRRALSATPQAASTEGYGEDPPRQPAASDPKRQPGASAAQTAGEHPGPDPPDVGKGTGAGPTKGAMHQSMNQAVDAKAGGGVSNSSSSSNSDNGRRNTSAGGGRPGGEALKGLQGRDAPQPKIYNQAVPGLGSGLTREQKREVEQHNRDFDRRHDRAAPAGEDKVDKRFWQRT